MHIQQFLREYLELHGYWVLCVGTFLEGETILLLAGFLAFQGYLNIYAVIGVAWLGSFCGDQCYFSLGRYQGRWLLRRFHFIARKSRYAIKMIEKYGNLVAFLSRFTYGFRIVLPIILGITTRAPRTFLMINLGSALVWAVLFSLGGYLFGKSASLFLVQAGNYEQHLILALCTVMGMVWCIHAYQVWKLKKPVRERLGRIRALRTIRRKLL